jgi:hypothetical protein
MRQRRHHRLPWGMRRVLSGVGGFVLIGLVCALTTVWLATSGAWLSALAPNGTNSYQAGSLQVSDDDSATALFSTFASPNDGYLTVGQTLTPRCLNLTYTGNWTGTTFTDPLTSLNGAHWFRTDPAKIFIANGGLEIVPDNTWQQYVENSTTNFSRRSVQVEASQEPGPSRGMFMLVKIDGQNTLSIGKQDTFFVMFEERNGVGDYVSIPWSAEAMRFWKITSLGQHIKWQYSPDGKTWTTGREKLTTLPLSTTYTALQASASTTSPVNARFNNFRSSPISGVRLFANPSGDLAPYLNLTIERGAGAAGGSGHSCAGFTPTSTVYTGTLAGMPTTYATGIDDWHPTTSPETVSYRISASTADVQAMAGKTASATFTWVAQAGA